MAELKGIANSMKELHDGFAVLCNNDAEILAIRTEIEKGIAEDTEVDIPAYERMSQGLEDEITRLRKSISENKLKMSEVDEELEHLKESFTGIDLNAETEILQEKSRLEINEHRVKADADIALCEEAVSKELLELKEKHEEKVAHHKDQTGRYSTDEYSEKALAFYTESIAIDEEKKEIEVKENGKIEEKTERNSAEVSSLTEQREETTAKYMPQLQSLQDQIDAVLKKYEGDIENKRNTIEKLEEERSEELSQVEITVKTLKSDYENQVSRLQNQFKQTDTDYTKQIKQAEREGRATTRLNSSRVSALNKINTEITKCENKLDGELTKQKLAWDKAEKKYDKQIEPVQKALEALIEKRNHELEPIQSGYDSLKNEMDHEVNRINSEIDTCNNNLKQFITGCQSVIMNADQTACNKHSDLLKRMTDYAMSTTKELDRFIDSALAAFHVLDHRKSQLKVAEEKAASLRTASQFNKLKQEADKRIGTKSYQELVALADGAGANIKVPSFPKIQLFAGIAAGAAVIVLALMILGDYIVPGVVTALILFIGAMALYLKLTSGQIRTILEYSVLTDKYKELPAIRDYAQLQTENLEVARLKECGQEIHAKLLDSDDELKRMNEEYRSARTEIEEKRNTVCKKIEDEFEMRRQAVQAAASEKLKELNGKAEKENASFHKRTNDLVTAINKIKDTIAENEERVTDAISHKTDLDGKIDKLVHFAEYRTKYKELQKIVKEDIRRIGEQEDDVIFPDPLYFFGGVYPYSKELNIINRLDHRFRSTVLLYNPVESGTIVQSIETFMRAFLVGILNSTDEGLAKEQYIIDITAGAGTFDTAGYKEAGIQVVDEKSLEKVIGKLQKECEVCRNSCDEYAVDNFGELNQRLRERRKHPLPCSILHIIVPKRDQVDNASKLLSNAFKSLIRNDNDKNGLIVLFYVEKDEWYAPDILSNDQKKDEDILYFIRRLGNLNKEEVYVIHNENAALGVDK